MNGLNGIRKTYEKWETGRAAWEMSYSWGEGGEWAEVLGKRGRVELTWWPDPVGCVLSSGVRAVGKLDVGNFN